MKSNSAFKQQKNVTDAGFALPSTPSRKPKPWRDLCGLSAQQWEYSARWPDYLDWALAVEAASRQNRESGAKD